jgi:TP901 family phage tail tape measure protein
MALQQTMSFTASTAGVTGPLQQMDAVMRQLEATANGLGATIGRLTTTSNGYQATIKGQPAAVQAVTNALRQQQNIQNIQIKKIQQVNEATKSLRASQQQLAQQTQSTAQQMIQGFNGVTLTWSGLLRLFQVQILHQVFGALSNEIQQSVIASVDFQTKVAEIRTISQSAQQTTEAWTKQLAGLSEEFGKPQADVAQAAYETLSNQIAKGAQSADFLRSSLALAITTNSSATDSVNLLSSAINSYGLDVSSSDRISAIFFKTIDLGRIKASELANTFGRVGPLAAQLGVSLEETAAALSTITRTGVPASESITFLNNIFTALLKPTEAMKKFLDGIGVSSGETAVQTFGLAGVLQKLAVEAEKGHTHIAQLFENIRGLKGITALTRELQNFDRDLAALGSRATVEFENARRIVEQTDAFQFNQLKQQIANFFTNEIGGQVVRGILAMSKSVGDVREPLTALFEIVKGGTETFLVWRLSLLTIEPATRGLQAIVPITTSLFTNFKNIRIETETWKQALSDPNLGSNLANAFTAGFAIEQLFERINNTIEQNQQRRRATEVENLRKQLADQTKETVANLNLRAQAAINAFNRQKQIQLQAVAEGRRATLQAAEDTNAAYAETIDNLKVNLGEFLDTIRQKIADIRSSLTTLRSITRSARGDFEENFRNLGESLFSESLAGASPQRQIAEMERQIQALTTRAREIIQRSLSDLGTADTEGLGFIKDDLALVRKMFEDVNKLIVEQVKLSQKDKGLGATSDDLRKKFDAFAKAQADFAQFQQRNVGRQFAPQELLKKQQEQANLLGSVKQASDELARATVSNSGLEASAITRIVTLNRERLASDQAIIAASEERAAQLRAELAEQEANLRRTAQDTSRLEKFSLLDPAGKLKDEFKNAPQEAISQLRTLQDRIRQSLPEGLSVDLRFKLEQDFARQIQLVRDQLSELVAKGQLDSSALVEGAASFTKQVQQNVAEVNRQLQEMDASLVSIVDRMGALETIAKKANLGSQDFSKNFAPDVLFKAATEFNELAIGAQGPGVQARNARVSFQQLAASIKQSTSELQRLQSAISAGTIKTSDIAAFDIKISEINTAFEKAKAELESAFKLTGIDPASVIPPGTTQSVKTQLEAITTEIKNLRIERDRLLRPVQQGERLEQGGRQFGQIDVGAQIKELQNQMTQLALQSKKVDFTKPDDVARLRQIQEAIAGINRQFGEVVQKTNTPLTGILTREQFEVFRQAQLQHFQIMDELRQRQQEQLQQGQQGLNNQATQGVQTVGSAVGASIQTMDSFFSSAQAQVASLRESLLSLNNIVISPQVAVGGGGGGGTVQTFAHGGMVNMFRPKGMDTVPAMLRVGEIVMNREVSQKFKSQLLALNSGRVQHFAKGGEVTNVGGITIHVQGGSTSEQTIRSIGKGLNRQIRRGVFKFSS